MNYKNLVISFIAATLTSSLAFGQGCPNGICPPLGEDNDAEVAIRALLKGARTMDFSGRTEIDKEPCQLHLTDNGSSRYFVVVEIPGSNNKMDDYIGVDTSVSEDSLHAEGAKKEVTFSSNRSWSNSSTENTVSIELNDGRPVKANGINQLRSGSCILDDTEQTSILEADTEENQTVL